MRVAADAAVGVVGGRRVQAAILGPCPEAATSRLASGCDPELLGRLLLVECDGHRRMGEVEEPGELVDERCWGHVIGLS